MANDHIQKVVDLENQELNEINERKARVRLQEIRSLDAQIKTLTERRAKIRQELIDMPWDEVTVDQVLGSLG